MIDYYWLDENKNIYKLESLIAASKFETENRHVRNTFIKKYDVHISTVFLMLDHGFEQYLSNTKDYKPVLFETMIFWVEGKELDQYQERYCTWKEALEGHRRAVKEVIKEIRKKDL